MHIKIAGCGLVTAGVIALAGCAASTGVLPSGPDTYTVTERFAPVRGGSIEAQKVAVTEANQYCQQQGKNYLPVNETSLKALAGGPAETGFAVTFRCLSSNDPDLKRTSVVPGQAPDIVIEKKTLPSQ